MVKFFITLFASSHTNSTTCPDSFGIVFSFLKAKELFQPTRQKETPFHPTPFAPLHSVTTLDFSNPISGMPCEVFTP
jgi:hypothetical protein